MHPWQRGLDGNVNLSSTIIETIGLGIRTLKPGKVPTLQLWFCLLEVCRSILRCSIPLCYSECEIRVWFASTGLASINRRMDLETNVKVLTGKEVGSAQAVSNGPSIEQ